MRYVGGKSRIAPGIVNAIARHSPGASLAVEPFMGGGAVTAVLAQQFGRVISNDYHLDLALMWQAVLLGWEPPLTVSLEEYTKLRDSEPSALRGFVGFGGSFGGKFFGGYARGGFQADGSPRNHQGESARAVMRIGAVLRKHDVTVQHGSYEDVPVPPGSVVYCDPPYASTQGYMTGDFDSAEFWSWAEHVSAHVPVFVSEYQAPPHWEEVWSAQKRQSITQPKQGREVRTERLFLFQS